LATTVTKKVVSNEDGLLCAEIIREFLQFYQMKHSLHVFIPEMSLSEDFPKRKEEIEREAGIADRDTSKPLLLRLLEQVKFGAPINSSQPSMADRNTAKSEVITFGSNNSSSFMEPKQTSPENSSPEPTAKKENSRKSKKDKPKKESKTKTSKAENGASSALTKLDDLPSLGGPAPSRGMNALRGGFGKGGDDDSNNGFDDFDLHEDVIGDSSNKFDNAEKHLKDFYQDEQEGFKMSSNNAANQNKAKKQGFKVNI